MAGFERALIVAAVIAFVGSIVAFALVRQEAEHASRRRVGARSVSTTGQTRLPAAERRQAIVDAALRSSRPAATAARRRRTSPGRPVSPSRSSIATSPRSGSSTSPASRRRGVACGSAFDANARRAGRPRGGRRDRRWRRASSAPPAEVKPADALDPGADRGRRGRGDPGATCAASCATCTTTSPTAIRRAQAAGGVRRRPRPDAEAWIFLGAALLLSVADRLGGLLGPDDFGRMAAQRLRWLTGSG